MQWWAIPYGRCWWLFCIEITDKRWSGKRCCWTRRMSFKVNFNSLLITGCRIDDELMILTITARYSGKKSRIIITCNKKSRNIITWHSVSFWSQIDTEKGKPNCLKGMKLVKMSIRPTEFLWFCISINIEKWIQTKNNEFRCFLTLKASFKFPASAPPNEVYRVTLVTNDVTSGTSQSLMFLFCLLDNCIASPTSICLFFVEENSSPLLKQQLP